MTDRERVAAVIHDVFCRQNAPMHSSPDHSAALLLAGLAKCGFTITRSNAGRMARAAMPPPLNAIAGPQTATPRGLR